MDEAPPPTEPTGPEGYEWLFNKNVPPPNTELSDISGERPALTDWAEGPPTRSRPIWPLVAILLVLVLGGGGAFVFAQSHSSAPVAAAGTHATAASPASTHSLKATPKPTPMHRATHGHTPKPTPTHTKKPKKLHKKVAPPPTVAPTPTPTDTTSALCRTTSDWTVGDETGDGSWVSLHEISKIEAQQQPNCDQAIWTIPHAGGVRYTVKYTDHAPWNWFHGDSSGATLIVAIAAPFSLHVPGAELIDPSQLGDWPTLRDVRYGGPVANWTTFVVKVDTKTPFRVTIAHRGASLQLTLSLAHDSGHRGSNH